MSESQHRVLVVGEALADILTIDGKTVESPGGSPANVALGLGRLGRAVSLLTDIGDDLTGRFIAEHLGQSGVGILPESVSTRRTSSARVLIGPDGAATYDFDVRWEPGAIADTSGFAVLHTGSIAAFLEPGASRVLGLMRGMAGKEVTFDPNIRPALIGSRDEALPVFETAAAASTVVKLSDEDAHWLYPELSPEQVLEHILTLGPRLVAITLGGEGSILSTGAATVRIPSVKVEVVDTIGAGDTYMAVLVDAVAAGTSQGLTELSLEQLGRRAATAAAITVSRAGAELPFASELSALDQTA